MLIPPDTTIHSKYSKNINTIDLFQSQVERLWCTKCGSEVGEPATHDCAVKEETMRKGK